MKLFRLWFIAFGFIAILASLAAHDLGYTKRPWFFIGVAVLNFLVAYWAHRHVR